MRLINASGVVTKTYDYDAYGNELTRDLNDPNPFRYCGEYYDTETGFIYLRARYYNPSNGRFISVDPAKDGLNWYAYCNNNPVAFVDRNGLWPTWEQILTAGIIVTVATVAIVATVASAGTAAPAIGFGLTATFGGTAATATTITTIATWGCYGLATGIGACAVSDVTEVFTGYNPIRDEVMGGNQQAYSFVEGMLYTGAAYISDLAANLRTTKNADMGNQNESPVQDTTKNTNTVSRNEPAVQKMDSTQDKAKCYTQDQQALIQLSKEAKKNGGVTLEEANILLDWAKEYNIPAHGPEIHPNRPGAYSNVLHFHIGKTDHIPIKLSLN